MVVPNSSFLNLRQVEGVEAALPCNFSIKLIRNTTNSTRKIWSLQLVTVGALGISRKLLLVNNGDLRR